ncbi:MAG TPA: HIT family protein [Nitrosomonas halophila]|nr:HIT family protein [Nitrosomonas halophila]
MNLQTFNDTMRKFGAPETIIHQYAHWSVQLRPAQLTLGALVLVAHEPVHAFSALGPASFAELQEITGQIESALNKAFQNDKVNYLMLMMVDPDVHFHVIPRYAQPRLFDGKTFVDAGWPGVPDFGKTNVTDSAANQRIIEHLVAHWRC